MKWLVGLLALALVVGGGTTAYFHFRTTGSAAQVSQDYFDAWSSGDFARMASLTADPPADFGERHRKFSAALAVKSLSLEPGALASDGEKTAHVDFKATRRLPAGSWEVRSTLKVAIVDRAWRVLWTPDVLLPGVKDLGTVKLVKSSTTLPTPVTRDGRKLPGGAGVNGYLSHLAQNYATEGDEEGWDLFADSRKLRTFGTGDAELRTTIDLRVQKAADSALGLAQGRPAALIALRPSTGEILGVADGLQGQDAFHALYPPGSTFKVVTAAALLKAGLSAGSAVSCPATTVVGGVRTIPNHDGLALGSTTFRAAFAQSCNTTFADLAHTRAKPDGLRAAAELFGFDRPFAFNASRASFPLPENDAELAEAAIGQGRVQATPLNMAAVAAAVADGTWRSPRMLPVKEYAAQDESVPAPRPLPGGLVAQLRSLMRAVVTEGTAEGGRLPSGTAGKTGTAEWDDQGSAHAWFIGYRGDLAFCAFVENGGSGAKAAVPVAARFLAALS